MKLKVSHEIVFENRMASPRQREAREKSLVDVFINFTLFILEILKVVIIVFDA